MSSDYEVFSPSGSRVMYGPERCRYPIQTEKELLKAGYVIRLYGKRIPKAGFVPGAAGPLTDKK